MRQDELSRVKIAYGLVDGACERGRVLAACRVSVPPGVFAPFWRELSAARQSLQDLLSEQDGLPKWKHEREPLAYKKGVEE